jgi:phosphoglycolate phosphatase-like HAD superfamily hydrolase
MEGSRVRVAKLDFGMAKDIKAVLFDLDGTLIDSIGLLLASMRYAFEGFDGEEPVTEDWVAGIGTPLMTQIRAYTKTEDQAIAVRDRYRDFQRDDHRLPRCDGDACRAPRRGEGDGSRDGQD